MSRSDEFKKENQNPCSKFLEWKGELESFKYWDKEKEENVIIELPFKFLYLKEMHTIRGWSNSSESSIYSNEVQFIGREELKVKSFKGGDIANGLWKDIKGKVATAGGHYSQSIYVMLEDGSIANINLKGGAVSKWYEFKKENFTRMQDEWMIIEDVEKKTNGSIKYNVPEFKFESSLSTSDNEKAEEVYATVKTYLNAYQDAQSIKDNSIQEHPPIEEYVHPDFEQDNDPF